MEQLLRRRLAIRIARRLGSQRRNGIQLRIAQGHRQWQMPRPQRRDIRDQRIRCEAVDHVGEEHRQGALAVARREISKGAGVIGLDELRFQHREHVQHAAHANAPALRRDKMLDAVGEGHDADIVVVLRSRVCQLQRGLNREVEPRDARRDLRRHQPTRVQHQQHLLAAFGLVLTRDHFVASRGRLPIDVAQIIARHPFAQRLEQPSLAELANRSHPGFAAQRLRHRSAEPHRDKRRVHHDFPGQHDAPASAAESQRTGAIDDESAFSGALAASTHRHYGDVFARRGPSRNGQGPRRLKASENGRPNFPDPQSREATRVIRPAVRDFAGVAYGESRQRFAHNSNRRRERCIDPDEDDERKIGKEHDVERRWIPMSQRA